MMATGRSARSTDCPSSKSNTFSRTVRLLSCRTSKILRMSPASSPLAGVRAEDMCSLSSRLGEEMIGQFGGRSARATCTRRRSLDMKKKFPVLKTDEEAEEFLKQDLTDYLHAGNFKSAQSV